MDQNPTRNLWIGGVLPNLREDQIRAEFLQFGALESVRIVPHKNCAFVNFLNIDNAATARTHMNGRVVPVLGGPAALRVTYAKGGESFENLPFSSHTKSTWDTPLQPVVPPLMYPGADPEDQNRIDKLAEFVVRNGPDFEQMMMAKQKDNEKFGFLFGGLYSDYYRWKLQELRQQLNINNGPSVSYPTAASAGPEVANQGGQQPQPQQQQQQQGGGQYYGQQAQSDYYGGSYPNQQQWGSYDQQGYYQQQGAQGGTSAPGWNGSASGTTTSATPTLAVPPPPSLPPELAAQLDGLLNDLNGSRDSIRAGKDWCLVNRSHAPSIVMAMRYKCEQTTDGDKKLFIIYLINDILHHSQKDRMQISALDDFAVAYDPQLKYIFRAAHTGNTTSNQERIVKVLHLWADREIYDGVVTNRVESTMKSPPTPPPIPPPAPISAPVNPTPPPIEPQYAYSSPQPPFPVQAPYPSGPPPPYMGYDAPPPPHPHPQQPYPVYDHYGGYGYHSPPPMVHPMAQMPGPPPPSTPSLAADFPFIDGISLPPAMLVYHLTSLPPGHAPYTPMNPIDVAKLPPPMTHYDKRLQARLDEFFAVLREDDREREREHDRDRDSRRDRREVERRGRAPPTTFSARPFMAVAPPGSFYQASAQEA